MASNNKEKANFTPLTINDAVSDLQRAGYEEVSIIDTPDGLIAFRAPSYLGSLRRGVTSIARSYAVYPINKRGVCIIGWSHLPRGIGSSIIDLDPDQLAVNNCLGRLTYVESHPNEQEDYLKKFTLKFRDSVKAQTTVVRPIN